MRIDSHVLLSRDHPPEHLAAILSRNKFDGAILFADEPVDLPHIVGTVVPLARLTPHPRICGVSISLDDPPECHSITLPVDVEIHPHQFEVLDRLAALHPTVNFAIDHLAHPAGLTEEWSTGLERAAGHANVYCKLSGLLDGPAARPFVQHALKLFGPGRLMFGSNWPACLPNSIWKQTLAAFTQALGAQTIEVREQLLGGTAEKFYRR